MEQKEKLKKPLLSDETVWTQEEKGVFQDKLDPLDETIETDVKPFMSGKDSKKRGRPPKIIEVTYTITDSFNKLCEIQERAFSVEPKPDFTAVLKSEELKGKLFGLYTEKKEKEKEAALLPRILVEFIQSGGTTPQEDSLEECFDERKEDIQDEADNSTYSGYF